MKSSIKKTSEKAAFTIIELLTVMSIIVILMGLIVPALNAVKKYAKDLKQQAQFEGIDDMMVEFSKEPDQGGYGDYPPSDALDTDSPQVPYCGAMKLAEAMVGRDLLGFHPSSLFLSSGMSGAGTQLYTTTVAPIFNPDDDNIKSRRGPLLNIGRIGANKLKHLYGVLNIGLDFTGEELVLCDVYSRVPLKQDPLDDYDNDIRGKSGMPILYYKADPSNERHFIDLGNSGNIYDYTDNDELLMLGLPWDIASGFVHPMASAGPTSDGGTADPLIFYENTRDPRIGIDFGRPRRADSYILISAGFDGLYGTRDDVFNFRKR